MTTEKSGKETVALIRGVLKQFHDHNHLLILLHVDECIKPKFVIYKSLQILIIFIYQIYKLRFSYPKKT